VAEQSFPPSLQNSRLPPLQWEPKSTELFFQFGEEFRLFDDVALVGALGDRFLLVKNLNGEADAGTVEHDDLDFGADDESNRNRFVVFEVDMGAQGNLPRGEGGLDAVHRGALDQLNEHGCGEHVDAVVTGLLGRHPLFDPALEAIRASDSAFPAHAPGVYAVNPARSFPGLDDMNESNRLVGRIAFRDAVTTF
jgi:hypothetical protein